MMGRKGRREETGEDCLRGTKYELQTEKKTWRSVARLAAKSRDCTGLSLEDKNSS